VAAPVPRPDVAALAQQDLDAGEEAPGGGQVQRALARGVRAVEGGRARRHAVEEEEGAVLVAVQQGQVQRRVAFEVAGAHVDAVLVVAWRGVEGVARRCALGVGFLVVFVKI